MGCSGCSSSPLDPEPSVDPALLPLLVPTSSVHRAIFQVSTNSSVKPDEVYLAIVREVDTASGKKYRPCLSRCASAHTSVSDTCHGVIADMTIKALTDLVKAGIEVSLQSRWGTTACPIIAVSSSLCECS